MIEARAIFVTGPLTGMFVPLAQPKLVIGRERDCGLKIQDDSLSRHHCVLLTDDFSVRVRDLGSKNGTLVNGEPLDGSARGVESGDVVSAGAIEIRIELGPPDETLSGSTILDLPQAEEMVHIDQSFEL